MTGLDLILAISLISVAGAVLWSRDLFRSIVLFISFGLLMALAWARLGAPDIALAEAAIGSAVTGALFLAVLGEFRLPRMDRSAGVRVLPMLGGLLFAFGLGLAVASLPMESVGLREVAAERAKETGVSNLVTAVLLSFRAYDTLLEIAVLLVASAAVLAQQNQAPTFLLRPSRSAVLQLSARAFLPLLILVAGYLLWVGAHAPGGAFQAGAVLAGGGVLASLADASWMGRIHLLSWRAMLSVGLVVFLLVGGGAVLAGELLLEYRGTVSKWLILVIEAAATLSIAVTLVVLIVGRIGNPSSGDEA